MLPTPTQYSFLKMLSNYCTLFAFFLLNLPRRVVSLPTLPAANVTTTGVSTDLLSRLNLYSQYCSAIYCPVNAQNPPGTLVTCPTGNSCPQVEQNWAYIHAHIYEIGNFSTTAMIAIDPNRKEIVLAYQGADLVYNPTALHGNLLTTTKCLQSKDFRLHDPLPGYLQHMPMPPRLLRRLLHCPYTRNLLPHCGAVNIFILLCGCNRALAWFGPCCIHRR